MTSRLSFITVHQRSAPALQTCYRCGQEQPLEAFITQVNDRRYRMCRSCVSEILLRRGAKRPRLTHTDTQRTCYLCDRVPPVASFTRRSNGTYFSACKDCNRHVFAQRRRARLAGSGGTYATEEWDRLLAQYERCPGCLRREPPAPLLLVQLAEGGTDRVTAESAPNQRCRATGAANLSWSPAGDWRVPDAARHRAQVATARAAFAAPQQAATGRSSRLGDPRCPKDPAQDVRDRDQHRDRFDIHRDIHGTATRCRWMPLRGTV